MKDKKLFEMALNDKAKLIVYADNDYNGTYFDSWLYFFDGKNEYELINDSFAFAIGKELYTRSYNVNNYVGKNFENELVDSASQDFYNRIGKFFEFVECENYDMYLFKVNGKVRFLLNTIEIESIKKKNFTTVKHKKLYETEVSYKNITRWHKILEKEFIPRYIAELKSINKDITDEKIQASVLSLKQQA